MKTRFYLAPILLCLTPNAYGREPVPMKWTVEGVEREALVYSPLTATKTPRD